MTIVDANWEACFAVHRAATRRRTCSANRSFLRRESDSSGLMPFEAINLWAKCVNLYVSPSGLGAHCGAAWSSGSAVHRTAT